MLRISTGPPPCPFAHCDARAAQIAGYINKHLRPKHGWLRVVVEKPFGRDTASAEMLCAAVAPCPNMLIGFTAQHFTLHAFHSMPQLGPWAMHGRLCNSSFFVPRAV